MRKKIVAVCMSLCFLFQWNPTVSAQTDVMLPITDYEKENGRTEIETFEYQQGATFGSQTTPKTLSKTEFYIGDEEYSSNWAQPQDTFYYVDKSGNYHIVVDKKKGDEEDLKLEQRLYDICFDEHQKVMSTKKITYALPGLGAFYRDPSGTMYVVSGQDNEKEDPNKLVIVVEKFDENWNLQGKTEIKGGVENLFQGIVEPFDAGSCRVTSYGKYLFVHTARLMFVHEDGVNHQSDISFIIDTETMTTIQHPKVPYVSHSFNQFVVVDELGNAYYLDHGDAYPRSLIISKYQNWTVPSEMGRFANQEGKKLEIFSFIDREKEHYNYTGCVVTGFEKIGDQLVTVGAAIPQDSLQSSEGKEYKDKNIFLIVTDQELNQSKTVWLTNYNPTGTKYKVSEPKLIKINEERFVVLYHVQEKNKQTLCYREIDKNGTLLEAINYQGVALMANSQPIFDGKSIRWLGYNDMRWSKKAKLSLYQIPYGTIPIETIQLNKTSVSLKEGEQYILNPNLTPELPKHLSDIVWTSSDDKTVTVKNGTLIAGITGTAKVTGTLGNKIVTCDVKVKYVASNQALKSVKLTTKFLSDKKVKLQWKPVLGATGYEIYRKSENGTYKKIKTVDARTLECVVKTKKATVSHTYKIRAYGKKPNGTYRYSKWTVKKTSNPYVYEYWW